jgi:hypothetical protein
MKEENKGLKKNKNNYILQLEHGFENSVFF